MAGGECPMMIDVGGQARFPGARKWVAAFASNRGFTGCRSSVFSPAAERRKFIAWRRQPQDVPNRPQPFPVPSPNRGDSRARPRRDCRPAGAGKGFPLTCLRVLGLTPPGYELALLRSSRNCRARPDPRRAQYNGKPLRPTATTSCPRSGRSVCFNSAFSRHF